MSILVATDFSPCSRTAVRLAAALARQEGHPLILVHAVPHSIAYAPQQPDQALFWQTNQVTIAEAMLATAAHGPREQGIHVRTEATIGDAASLILGRSRESDIALVVLGTHGRGEAARFFLGSVAEAVVRAANVPVLVTPPHDPRIERWEGQSPLDLLVGSDGSAASPAGLRWADAFATQRAAGISLMRAYWPAEEALRYGLETPWGRPRPDAQLLQLVERDMRRDIDPPLQEKLGRIRFRVAAREAAEVLNEEAVGLGADAVVIAVPKRWSNRSLRRVESGDPARLPALGCARRPGRTVHGSHPRPGSSRCGCTDRTTARRCSAEAARLRCRLRP